MHRQEQPQQPRALQQPVQAQQAARARPPLAPLLRAPAQQQAPRLARPQAPHPPVHAQLKPILHQHVLPPAGPSIVQPRQQPPLALRLPSAPPLVATSAGRVVHGATAPRAATGLLPQGVEQIRTGHAAAMARARSNGAPRMAPRASTIIQPPAAPTRLPAAPQPVADWQRRPNSRLPPQQAQPQYGVARPAMSRNAPAQVPMVISDDDEEDEDGEDEEEYSEDDQVDQSEDAAATSSAAAAPAVPFNPYSCGLYHASIITDLTAIVSSPYDFESALHGWLQHLDSMVVGPFFSCWCSQITTHSYGAARRHIRAVHGSLPPDEIDQRQNSDDVELVKASEQQEQEAEEEEDVEMQTEEEQKKRGAMPSRHTIGSKHIELPPPPPRSPVRGFPTRKRARSI